MEQYIQKLRDQPLKYSALLKGTDEIQEATPEKVERPVNAEDKVFKKRYDDLKRHYDSAVNKHKEEVFKLKNQLV